MNVLAELLDSCAENLDEAGLRVADGDAATKALMALTQAVCALVYASGITLDSETFDAIGKIIQA